MICPTLFSVTIQNQLGMKRICFLFIYYSSFSKEPMKNSSPGLEEGTEAERFIEECCFLTCFPCTYLENFLVKHSTTWPGLTLPTVGWVFPPQQVINTQALDMPMGQSDRDNSSGEILTF